VKEMGASVDRIARGGVWLCGPFRATGTAQVPRLETESPRRADRYAGVEPRRFSGRRFRGDVILDNTIFERCAFKGARLVYFGGPPPSIRDCTFDGVSFQFDGAAGRTLAFLQAMTSSSSGFRDVFKASFPRLFGH
jgi:hypothetical protein